MSIQNSLSNAFDSFTRKINSYRQTPLEKQVSEATSNENWGVANSTLIELARATADYNNYAVIMKGIWEGVSDKKERWRRIYKSLVLLEYCVKHGAERCADEAKGESYRLRPLHDFKFMEEGRDKGAGIREKSKQLTDLLGDPEALRAERNKAREGKEKYAGVASNSAGGQTMVTPSGYAGSYGGSRGSAAISAASVGNSTAKLDEYREREKQRLEAKKAEEMQAKAAAAKQQQQPQLKAPTYTQSGKLVVKAPALKGRKSDESSSSSSSSDSNVGGGNLIDFDAPVKQPAAPVVADPLAAIPVTQPAMCTPGYPAPVTQQQPAMYQQQPTGGYAAFNMMQQTQPLQQNTMQMPPAYNNPYMMAPQQPMYPNYGYGMQPQAQPTMQPNTAYTNNPYGQAPMKEQSRTAAAASTNPFDAFNGL